MTETVSAKIFWDEVTETMRLEAKEGSWFADDKLVYWIGEDAAAARAHMGRLYREQRKREVKTMTTNEHVVRYVAWDNPKVLVESANTNLLHPKKGDNSNTSGDGGREICVYTHSIVNRSYPKLKDGLYASIVSYQGIDYLFETECAYPDFRRKQDTGLRCVDRIKTYTEAKDRLLSWIVDAEDWLLKQGFRD